MRRKMLVCLLCLCMLSVNLLVAVEVRAEEVATEGMTEAYSSLPRGLLYNLSDGTVTITGYTGTETELTIPSEIHGDPVTSIGNSAFYLCDSLTSVTIPEGVTSIESGAFSYCSSLMSVTIPASVTSIGDEVFENVSSLTDVFYTGSETEWNEILLGHSNENLLYATIHFNSSIATEIPTDAPAQTDTPASTETVEPTETLLPIEMPTVIYGDVDGDGEIMAADALLVLKFVVRLQTLSMEQQTKANVNLDTSVTAEDALLILQHVVNLIDHFPAEKQDTNVSEMILMQRYTDILACVSLGGYWPEDKEKSHNERYKKYLIEYYSGNENYFAITDVNKDGKKELLIKTPYDIKIYNYDLEKEMEIVTYQDSGTEEKLKQYFQAEYGKTVDEIKWTPLESGNYSLYTEAYVKYYMGLLEKDTTTDIVLISDLFDYLSSFCGLEVSGYTDYEWRYEGEVVFSYYDQSGGLLCYEGKKLNDITLCGLYPGMKEELAEKTLAKYGFQKSSYQYSEDVYNYYTGGGIGNYFVKYHVENGVIISIYIYEGSLYVG